MSTQGEQAGQFIAAARTASAAPHLLRLLALQQQRVKAADDDEHSSVSASVCQTRAAPMAASSRSCNDIYRRPMQVVDWFSGPSAERRSRRIVRGEFTMWLA
jgi:hypothetical protein